MVLQKAIFFTIPHRPLNRIIFEEICDSLGIVGEIYDKV